MYSLTPFLRDFSIPTILGAFLFVLFLPLLLSSQPSGFSEQYLENLEEQLPIDNNTLLEELQIYLQHPLDINKDPLSPLLQVGLLTDYQIQQLQEYQYRIGSLLSIYELQAVPGFDIATIKRIQPFITTQKDLDAIHLSLKDLIRKSDKTLYVRWQKVLETKRGYRDNTTSSNYLGNAHKYYLRYFQSYGTKMSFGITAEKDPGELFFKGTNRKGLDFYSFHFFMKNIHPKISRIVVGDFAAQFGQGLLLNTRFSSGKGAFVTNIKRSGPSLNRFTSVSEYLAFRGAGISWKVSANRQLTSFLSFRKRDATIRITENAEEESEYFSAFQLSGYHRTKNEIEKRQRVSQFTTGIQFKQVFKSGSIQLNSLFNQFDSPFLPRDQPYNLHRFRGTTLWNSSLDYQYTFRNYHFFGETALSQNGAVASVNGIISSLLPTLDVALHWRHLPPAYHSLFGQSFAETSSNNNEHGVYLGASYQPSRKWVWSVYADFWRHPWLRYLVDEPSKGSELYSRVSYTKRKKINAYLQIKREYKQRSYKVQDYSNKVLLTRAKTNMRLHYSFHKSNSLEFRSRLELSYFKLLPAADPNLIVWYSQNWVAIAKTKRTGYLLYQDILYKPIGKPLSLTARIAIFNIDNYDARIYAYENDLLNQFSIPAYYNKGNRFYLNIRYQARKWLTLEGRVAQTYWWNQESIGSGLEKIDGPRRTEVKIQMKCRF